MIGRTVPMIPDSEKVKINRDGSIDHYKKKGQKMMLYKKNIVSLRQIVNYSLLCV